MKTAKPIAVLAPPLLFLALGIATLWLDLAQLRSHLSLGLFSVWAGLAHNGAPALRPTGALGVEAALLLAGGAAVIFLIHRFRLYWAGLFTIVALAALFEASWFLFVSRHWAIDAATPGFALALVFAAGAMARSWALQETRSKLRIGFCDSLAPATIEDIARNPQLLSVEGENRTVTYLACALRQPAGLAGKYRGDPKSFTRLIGEVLSPLVDQVLAHGGTIDRQTADGFAAFWNAPLDDGAHALHACEAASGMAAMVERVNEYVTGLRGPDDKFVPPLEISVGIATGPVIAGDFGGRGRMAYSVHGDAVALAARIQALSPQYGPAVIVSEETKAAAQQAFAFLEVDYIAAGKDDPPVRLYALLGRPATRSSPKFKALNTFHEHIFKALRGRQWAGARELIAQCRKLSGASPALYDLHLARIQYLESNPPPPDWDGAFRPILK